MKQYLSQTRALISASLELVASAKAGYKMMSLPPWSLATRAIPLDFLPTTTSTFTVTLLGPTGCHICNPESFPICKSLASKEECSWSRILHPITNLLNIAGANMEFDFTCPPHHVEQTSHQQNKVLYVNRLWSRRPSIAKKSFHDIFQTLTLKLIQSHIPLALESNSLHKTTIFK